MPGPPCWVTSVPQHTLVSPSCTSAKLQRLPRKRRQALMNTVKIFLDQREKVCFSFGFQIKTDSSGPITTQRNSILFSAPSSRLTSITALTMLSVPVLIGKPRAQLLSTLPLSVFIPALPSWMLPSWRHTLYTCVASNFLTPVRRRGSLSWNLEKNSYPSLMRQSV